MSRPDAGKPEVRLPTENRRAGRAGRCDQLQIFAIENPRAGGGQKEGPTECLRLRGHSISDGSVLSFCCVAVAWSRHQ